MSRQQRGVDRILAFSDGVVAIAITLLVLPLTEIEPDDYPDPSELFAENSARFVSFAVSFAVIAVFWTSHHRILNRVVAFDGVLLRVNLLWLACIVFLPFPTAMVQEDSARGYTLLYTGTMLAASLTTKALGLVVAHRPGLTDGPPDPDSHAAAIRGWLVVAGFATAFVIALVSPHWALWSLLLLVLTRPVTSVLTRRTP